MDSPNGVGGNGHRENNDAKALGAYYTEDGVAAFLIWWSLRSPRDTVLDPSFGGGVFLRSACERLIELGGSPSLHIFGAEIDPLAHREVIAELGPKYSLSLNHIVLGDFFSIGGGT